MTDDVEREPMTEARDRQRTANRAFGRRAHAEGDRIRAGRRARRDAARGWDRLVDAEPEADPIMEPGAGDPIMAESDPSTVTTTTGDNGDPSPMTTLARVLATRTAGQGPERGKH